MKYKAETTLNRGEELNRAAIDNIFKEAKEYIPTEFYDKIENEINPDFDYIEVYRGCNENTIYNYSWTTSPFMAIAYSNLQGDNLRVVHGKVKKDNIFAYLDTIKMSFEVIVINPHEVEIIDIWNKEDIRKNFPYVQYVLN